MHALASLPDVADESLAPGAYFTVALAAWSASKRAEHLCNFSLATHHYYHRSNERKIARQLGLAISIAFPGRSSVVLVHTCTKGVTISDV